MSGCPALASQALSLEFSTYGTFSRTGIWPGPKMPGCTASGSEPVAHSPREPSSTARPDAGNVARPSGVEQRSASSSVTLGSTCACEKNVCPEESAAIVFTHGRPWVRRSASFTPAVDRAVLNPSAVSPERRLAAFGSSSAYAVVPVHGSGRPAPREVRTGPYRVHHCVRFTVPPPATATATDRFVIRCRLPSTR